MKKYTAGGGKLVTTGSAPENLGNDAANVERVQESVGELYDLALTENFAETRPERQDAFLNRLDSGSEITIDASPMMATSISTVEGKPHIFFANFAGLKPHEVAIPSAQKGVTVRVAHPVKKGWFLPFMGNPVEVQGKSTDKGTIFTLPEINRGAVFWFEQ